MAQDPVDAYDDRAERYAENNPTSPAREGYEWPAVRELLPDLGGLRVLDAACGPGYFSAWMADRGADVLGIDASERMIDVARERHGDAVEFRVADLCEPLDVGDELFDLVVCQLALEHVENWDPVMDEFARVLADDGLLVFSTDHPFTTYYVIDLEPRDLGSAEADEADYYAVEEYTRDWGDGGMTFYRRPLQAVLDPLFDAGFAVDGLEEPRPQTDFELHQYFEERTPRFVAVRARKV